MTDQTPETVDTAVPLACERPRDINLVKHRLAKALRERPDTPVAFTADEARTLLRSMADADRRLCSD